ncbi:hypothetical protein CDL15_Pgr019128 [Punica granatum]|uniref:Uncharacterized protein n=1 Tax=Punica granatum TaxID=22663 RepID=A0A218XKV1_PUNGR|nr:hypothetical protein CDL15_Pgr019128 [Punica granatum]
MRVVIILDDLWKKLDLEEIGIKEMKDDIKVKLVMTSRYRHVLADEMHCRQVFHLEKLKNEEALKLFGNTAANKLSDPLLKHTAEELAKKCEGLPLLIDALAKVLQNSDSPKDWEDALEQLIKSDSVHKALELSFRHLVDSQVKLLSIISGVDVREGISDETLLRYGVGLGLLAGSTHTMEAARGRMRELLDGLRATSLLLDCGDNCVKAHDVVREAVISIAARDQYALVLRDKKDLEESDVKLCESKEIFLPYPDIRELPCIWECSELEILVLFAQEDRLLQVPYLFFTIMPKLKVLHFARACFKPLPSSIRHLKNLQTLCLEYCDLEDVRFVRELKNLQVLSFMGSNITQLPKEVGELAALRSLDLSHCSRLEVIEPGSLEGLVQLEELYLEKSFVQWNQKVDEQQSNASISELNKMHRLSNLDVLVPDVDMLREDMQFFWKLDKYIVLIGDKWKWSEICKGQRTLKVTLKGNGILSEEWFQLTLQRTEDLHLHGSDGTKRSIHGLCREGFKELKHLHVERSPSTHYLVRSTECAAESAFIVLESLFLDNLSNLEKICHGLPAKGSFERLKIVRVHGCQKLKNLFSLALLRDLRNLEEIEVIDCGMMQEIVVSESTLEDDRKDKVAKGCLAKKEKSTKDDKIKLHSLRRIKLEKLRNLTTFLTNAEPITLDSQTKVGGGNLAKDDSQNTVSFFNSQQVLLPCLESLELLHLPKLTGIWQDQHSVEWSKLKSLRIEACRNLLKVVDSSNLIMKLESLESLSIENCESMEEVFDLRGVASGTVNKILPRLHALELEDLPSLRCLWNTTSPEEELPGFQNLGSLKVDSCSGLRCVFTASMVKAMANLKELDVQWCDNMEAIVMDDGEDASKRSWFSSSKVLKAAVECPSGLMFSPSSFSSKHVDGDKVEGTTEKAKDKAENIIAFPSLRMLNINDCDNMKSFVLSCKREQEAIMMAGDDSSDSESKDDSHAVFFNTKVHLPSLEELSLGDLTCEKIWHDKLPQGSFCKLGDLRIGWSGHLSVVFPSTFIERLKNLKSVCVRYCSYLRRLFAPVSRDSDEKLKWMSLPELKEVELYRLPRLTHVVENGSRSHRVLLGFPSLTKVEVLRCERLMDMFPTTTAATLSKLEEVSIQYCDSMEEVIVKEEGDGEGIYELTFPRLSSLKLCHLNNLICFSSASCSFYFPSLEDLSLKDCHKMEAFISPITHTETAALFFNEKVELPKLAKLELSLHTLTPPGSWQSLWQPVMFSCPEFHGVPSFAMKRLQRLERLTCLEIYGCQQRNLFTSSQVKYLRHLQCLKIESCRILEHVITDGDSLTTGGIVFPCLTKLELRGLPELCSFYHERHTSCKESDEESSWEDEDSLHHQIQPSLFWVEQVSFPSLEELAISSIGKLKMIWHGQAAPDAFSQLTEINVERCNKLEHVFKSDMLQYFVNIEKLRIGNCSSLLVIYDLQGVGNAATTAHLKELKLYGLRELKHIWKGDPTGIVSFQNLSTVDVTECKSLAYLFHASLAESLLKLEKLTIRTSSQLEVVVADDEVDKVSDDRKLVFPQLEDLTLKELQELKSFHSGRRISQFPLLKKLTVEGVGYLVELLASDFGSFSVPSEKGSPVLQQPLFLVDKVSFPRLEELSITGMKNLGTIWRSQITEGYCFSKLKEITVEGCDALVTIFPPNTVRALRKLEKLHVISCPSLRVIYHMQGLTQDRVEYSDHVVVGAQLKELLLRGLPKLEHIWNIADPGRILSFHNLGSVKVGACESLKYVFPPSVAKVLYNLNVLWIENNSGLEEIVAAAVEKEEIAAGTSEFVFPRATSLKLSGLLGLNSFCQRRHISKWPSLEKLEIKSCDRIRNLFCHIDFFQDAPGNSNDVGSPPQQTLFLVDKVSFLCLERLEISSMNNLTTIWHSQVAADSLSELIEITVEGCDKLVTLFPPGTACSFQNLEVLEIRRWPPAQYVQFKTLRF